MMQILRINKHTIFIRTLIFPLKFDFKTTNYLHVGSEVFTAGKGREAIVIELHPNNMNRDAGFCLIKSWKSLICSFNNSPTRRLIFDAVYHREHLP
jgi:hypothetical protein